MAAFVPALREIVSIWREGTPRLTARLTFGEALDPIPTLNGAPTDAKFAGHCPHRPPLTFEHLQPLVTVKAYRAPLTQVPLLAPCRSAIRATGCLRTNSSQCSAE